MILITMALCLLKLGRESPLTLFSVFKIVLLSYFHVNFRVNLLISASKDSWYFDRDSMRSIDNLWGEIAILRKFSFSTNTEMSFHLFMSLNYFNDILMYKSCIFLLNLFLRILLF